MATRTNRGFLTASGLTATVTVTVTRPMLLTLLVTLLMMSATPGTHAAKGDWPQYRGPGALATADAPGLFERPADVGLTVAWSGPTGSGYSSLVIADGRVVTMMAGKESDFVIAYDETTGKELWRHAIGPAYKGHDGSHDGPLSTPLVAGDRVIGLSAVGNLFAVNVETGKELWAVDLVAEFEAAAPGYGFAASPLLADGMVILQVGSSDSTVAGFSLQTGERVWTVGSDRVQYQTPVVIQHGDNNVIVAAGQANLFGIDPKSGKVLFELPYEGAGGAYGAGGLTPLPVGDGLLFLTHKDDGGKVVRLKHEGDGMALETLWENRNIRHSYITPVYHDGHIYAYSSRFLTCVNALTGEPAWRSREPGDGAMAVVDGHLVIVTKDGGLHIAPATPDGYNEIAGMEVFDDVAWAGPSFANGHIYVRSLTELAKVRIGEGRTLSPADDGRATIAGTQIATLIKQVDGAESASAKNVIVDRFMESIDSFPLTDGKDRVHFLYRGEAKDVAVAGDLFGVSLEASLTQIEGTDLFYYTTHLAPDARINYVLLVDYEQVLDPLNPRVTQTAVVRDDMELNFSPATIEMSWMAMPKWKAPGFLKASGAGGGTVEAREFDSATTGGKVGFDIYLPSGYAGGDQRYPVVYVHGGAAAKDRGGWPTALNNLIGSKIRPVIAVFVGPIRARGGDYATVFAEELIPFVDANFRTVDQVDSRASVGGGFGGNNAFMSTILKPGVVGKVATQSAFMLEFAWNPILPMIKTAKEQPLDLYIDWGRYDLRNRHEAWDLADVNREIAEFLKQRGYQPKGGEVNDGAGWSNWRNRTAAILETFFPI